MGYINTGREFFAPRFGEPQPQPAQRPALLDPGLQLRMPPFETIMGYRHGNAALSGPMLERIKRVAEFVANSWRGAGAITQIRVTGYIDARESQADLGRQRADYVRNALIDALRPLSPGLATRIVWTTEDRGLAQYAQVEIYLWAGPTPMPVPPLVRTPSPAEGARRMVPQGPETPEQRIDRILRTLPPAVPKRTYSQAFWQKLDDQLNSTMSRWNVPQSLRGKIRDGIHAGIKRGSEALIDQILDAAEMPGDVKKAIKSTARGITETPMR